MTVKKIHRIQDFNQGSKLNIEEECGCEMLKRELNIWHLPVSDEGYNLFEDCRRRTVVILMNADERSDMDL